MDDFPAPPARPGGDTLRAAGQWLASVKGRPGTAVGQTGWIPNVPTPEPTRDMGDLVRHGAQLRLALDLIEFEAADELRPYDENLHTIARRLLDTIEQLTGTPLAAIEAVGGHVVRKER
ncbi:hypothetical protein ABZ605_27775 [Streptomyces sp. NPDC012765]|uniref:hypothetical protein n=1 Tax=Streptomyces sp. NPDC012765 TaxID=3155249 RepID=UPI0033EB2EDE